VTAPRVRPFDARLLRRAAAARRLLAVDVGAGVAGTLLLLAQVSLVAAVVAGVVAGETDAVAPGVVALLVAAIAGRAAMAWLVEVSGRRAAAGVMSSLRTELVARRLRRGGGDLATGSSGELATAAVQGVDGLETYFARYLPQVVLAVVVPVAVLAWTAAVDVTSAVIVAVTVPVVPVFMALIGRAAAHRSRQRWAALTVLGAHFLDVVRGLPTLRAFNRGRAQIPKIAEAADLYRRTTMGTLRLSFLSGAVLDLAATLSTALVAVTLGVRLVGGQVALRPALTVLLLVPELYAPLRQLGSMFHASADGLAAASRILDVLESGDAPAGSTPVRDVPPPADGPSTRGWPDPGRAVVRLRGVSVRFAGRPVPALDRVDLAIGPGELLAVTGPSGAGKSTLGQVLLGVRLPDEGQVLVGERALAVDDLDDWRLHLAWAPQHPVLVHASVAVNIALGAPAADRGAVEAAARAAGAHTFVAALPRGYDTVLGSGGRALSPGQRQRLGLARALLRDASLTVLDEPTVHLDGASVDHVARTLDRLRGRGTIVLITHDPRLMAVADRRVVLHVGRVVPPAADARGVLVAAEAAP